MIQMNVTVKMQLILKRVLYSDWSHSFVFLFYTRREVAMPFGCLAIGEKKDYHSPSDVTDKYDLGPIVKSWVSQQLFVQILQTRMMLYLLFYVIETKVPFFVFLGRSFARSSGPRTKLQWKCIHVKSSWKRMGERSARLPKMRSSS